MQQLPLGLRLRTDAGFDNFLAGDNAALLRTLRAFAAGDATLPALYLHGGFGSGRSHLLNAVASEADRNGGLVAVLPLQMSGLSPEVLAGFDQCELVCVDDVDAVCQHRDWAEALFNLFNAVRDRGGRLLFAADRPPTLLNCALPDLQSRLASMLVLAVQELSDADKQTLLIQRGEERGLRVPMEVAQYLMSRHSRAVADLLQLLDRLDHASLSEQRRLTIPFVKQVLGG
ncbi:DnaA regulatory inactivator Hda [Permianibacter sp. IMCC34836]|uniref:DnaA regulatory inactivator Hda n=1 Tax=Permianibacter fluminis TaxID=2738515 RepID=UPI00155263A1|nr:DnaA regulatory inactivator Hda [Permianibacter fluminis]NQD37525.1 DnaA regulatory inactivator Hda [Permianibacter fluminis]